MSFLLNTLFYFFSFLTIWYGAGLIISSIERFSKKLKLSSFSVSFFLLGLLTSTPEFAVGLTAVTKNDPQIFVGNLLGGIIVIFLFIIPLLAIFGNGITLYHKLDKNALLLALCVIVAPSFLILDKKVTNTEGIILIFIYIFLFYFIERKKGIFDSKNSDILHTQAYSLEDIGKVLFGIILVFVSSQIIVDKTLYFAKVFSISEYYISLIMLSLGTNLPEISLAVRSVISGKKDVAFGDYMGSAAANTLLFGFFTLLNNGEVLTVNNFLVTFLFISLSLGLFYALTRVHNNLTRDKGIILFILYILFVVYEFLKL